MVGPELDRVKSIDLADALAEVAVLLLGLSDVFRECTGVDLDALGEVRALAKRLLVLSGPGRGDLSDKALHILEVVGSYFQIDPSVLLGSGRNMRLSRARMILAYSLRSRLGMGYPALGRFLGRKHTAAMYLCKRAEELHRLDSGFRSDLANVRAILRREILG